MERSQPSPAGIGAAALVALVVALALGAGGWPGAPSGCIAAGDCACEALGEGLIRQPVNAASSLFFVLAGMRIISLVAAEPTSRRPASRLDVPSVAYVFGALVTFLGVGSALFHASVTEWGGWLDLTAIHLFIGALVVYDLAQLMGRGARWFTGVLVGGGATIAAVFWFLDKGLGRYSVGVLVVTFLVLEMVMIRSQRTARNRSLLLAAAGLLVAGQVAWWLWRGGGPLCAPDSLFQGHAVWHAAAAGAVVMLVRYLWMGDRTSA